MDAERADVIVVGTRCAGSAVATALARAGRRVVGLDSAVFPSDTMSTHLLWPSGVAEIAELGALPRVRALGAPPLTTGMAVGAGYTVEAPFTAYGGIDYALCVRRPGLDAALVETARAAGADLRERARVTELVWTRERVSGVRYLDAGGRTRELRAPLVVGADGRRSTVARLVGASAPYRSRPSGRACCYAYFTDVHEDWRSTAAQWRAGALLGTAFPCDDGLTLCLLQPPVDALPRGVTQLDRRYRDMIGEIPGLASRLAGCAPHGRARAATGLVSYFRRASGPGWALPGDAGHFKDPVTAQGIRDALRFGRLLGETVADVLDDPAALDARLLAWELRREAECLEMYQYTSRFARGEPMTPLEVQLYRAAAADPTLARSMLEIMSRTRLPRHLLTPIRAAALSARALLAADRPAAVRAITRALRDAYTDRRERTQTHRPPDSAPPPTHTPQPEPQMLTGPPSR